MSFININLIFFIGLILFYIFSKLKKIVYFLFISLNTLLAYMVYTNFFSNDIILNNILSPIYSDAISSYLLFLTILISLTSFVWILKSKNWLELIIIIFITEMCLFQVFSTKNLFFFYVFFELSALPLLFLIIVRGPTFRKTIAFNYFLGYTLLGSFFFFIALTILFNSFNSFNISDFNLNELDTSLQTIIWFCFLITFFIKVPVLPFHLWLLEAHVEAPTLGSVILAALLLKIGGYGLFRFCLILFPEISMYWSPLILTIAMISMIYSTFTAFVQLDVKRIIAYSSIAHMNASVVGLFSFNLFSLYGSLLNMIAHGFTSAALFFLIGMLYKKFHTKNLAYYGGLASYMPNFHFFLIFFILSNIAFPGTFNFICEILILIGINTWSTILGIFFLIANSFVFLYCILLLTKICYGEINSYFQEIIDIDSHEIFLLSILAICTISFGIYPDYFLSYFETNVKILFLKLG